MRTPSRGSRSAPPFVALLILIGVAAPAAAVDPTETARLMIQSGLLGAAERPRDRFVAAFETLSAESPAFDAAIERPEALQLAVASTFPPAQLRERWLRELAARLDAETFVAARAFFASIPGQTVASALRSGFRDGFRDRDDASASALDRLGLLTDATARDLVIDVHAQAMALWAVRLIADSEPDARAADRATDQRTADPAAASAPELSFEGAFERALDDSLAALAAAQGRAGTARGAGPDDPETEAIAQLPAPYIEAFLAFSASAAGDRFFTTSSIALEAALRQLARSQAGYFMEVMQRHPQAVPLETP